MEHLILMFEHLLQDGGDLHVSRTGGTNAIQLKI